MALPPFQKKVNAQDFYALKKIHRPRPRSNPRTSDPEASMETTGPPRGQQDNIEHNSVANLFRVLVFR